MSLSILSLALLMVATTSTASQLTMLYRMNQDQAIYIVDKLNKLSVLDGSINPIQTISHADSLEQLTVLSITNDHMLVGSIDKTFNISLNDLNQNVLVNDWSTVSKPSTLDCDPKRNVYFNPYECKNYIRVGLVLESNGQSVLITCGTNMNKPYCRKSSLNEKQQQRSADDSNMILNSNNFALPQLLQVPRSYQINTQNVAPYAYSDAVYYFHSQSPSQDIYKQRYELDQNGQLMFNELTKTPIGAIKNPNFRTSFGYEDKIYTFFSESNIADFSNDISFKVPTSYVGEMCANDPGRMSFSEPTRRFLTFKKTVINCYVPDYPESIHIKYTEIQEASKHVQTESGSVFYSIFTLRRANSVDSALCMYKLNAVESAMKGFFRNSPEKKPFKPLPTCNNYKSLTTKETDEYYREMTKYAKFHMDQTLNERALFALNNVKFTSLVVDHLSDSSHAIFIGLSDGRILKLVNKPVYDGQTKLYTQPIVVNEYRLFHKLTPITKLIIHVDPNEPTQRKLIAMTNDEIKSMLLSTGCDKYSSCDDCVYAQDPYCSWSVSTSSCTFSLAESNGILINDLNSNSTRCKSSAERLISSESSDNLLNSFQTESSFFERAGLNMQQQLLVQKSGLRSPSSSSSTVLYILLVFIIILITCAVSIALTCLFIRKNFVINELNNNNNRKQRSSANMMLDFVYKHIFKDMEPSMMQSGLNEKLVRCDEKVVNVYEINRIKSKDTLKPVSVLCSNRPNSASSTSDLPMTNTSSSMVGSNNNSPNNLCSATLSTNLLTTTTSKFSSIDDDDDDDMMDSTSASSSSSVYNNKTQNLLITGQSSNV